MNRSKITPKGESHNIMKISVIKKIQIGVLLIALFGLSSFIFGASGGAQNPSGTWVWDSEIQGETETNFLNVRTKGEAIVGDFKRGDVEATIRAGKLSNEGIEFEIPIQLNSGREWVFTCEAKIEGNDLTGSYRFEGSNGAEEREWNATRKLTNEDVTGTWNLHIDGPDGVTYKPKAIFELGNGVLVGTYDAVSIEQRLPMLSVEIDGDKLSFSVDQPDLKLNYVGTVTGKSISGNLEFDIQGNSGDVAFTGKLAD